MAKLTRARFNELMRWVEADLNEKGGRDEKENITSIKQPPSKQSPEYLLVKVIFSLKTAIGQIQMVKSFNVEHLMEHFTEMETELKDINESLRSFDLEGDPEPLKTYLNIVIAWNLYIDREGNVESIKVDLRNTFGVLACCISLACMDFINLIRELTGDEKFDVDIGGRGSSIDWF